MAKVPEKLGKYEIKGKLGKGAMGEVYKGHDPVLNRDVAIKVIAESLDADSDLVERFRREAKMAAQLNHPNIITIYDFVEEDGNLYIVMELLDGKDLKDMIRAAAPLTVEQILGMMEQIADGLGFAHDAGMVHRDLKPANIHVTKKGQIKILDFGLVHDSSSDMTKTGHVMGTPNYMSPEQVQGLKVDPRSDIFSLGAVFYELLTRKKPFSADSIHATMFKVVQGDREPLAQYTQLPGPLVNMVDRALDANPDERFADGNALRAHLRELRNLGLARGAAADSTLTSGMDGTMVTPGGEPISHASTPSRSERSVPARSSTGSSASGSRGGTMRRREMAAQSASTGMSSMGATVSPRPIGLYVGGGVLVLAIAAGLIYFSGPQQSGPSVEELSQALVASKQELMLQTLEQHDYRDALGQAEELLAADPQNAEAQRVQQQAQQALGDIETAAQEARDSLEAGNTAKAAEALSRVLALDPSNPLGTELRSQLNQHFQAQAESAQAEMDRARSAATSAGASSTSEFQQAEQQRQTASADFNAREYTSAAQGFLAARDQYARARTAHQQAANAQQQAQRRASTEQQQQQQQAQAALQRAQSAWTRSRNQPAEAGIAELPSYQRAIAEETAAKNLERGGDLAGAARAYETASSYLETARKEFADAQARLAADQRRQQQQVAAATTSTPVAPATTSTPSAQQEEAAVLQAIATYERAIESKDIGLFRRIKPNTTADEAKRLEDSFKAVDSQVVELEIRSVSVQGDTATVTTTRRDLITVRGRSQNGNSRPAVFTLTKSGDSWIISQIQ